MDRQTAESVTLRAEMSSDNSIHTALQQAREQLHNCPSPSLDAEILLSHVLQESRSYLYTWAENSLDQQQQTEYQALIKRRCAGEPVAYLVGEREFWSLPFKVNQHTLIPRPETELMVEAALELGSYLSTAESQIRLIDLGTGSGCVALALAKEQPNWQIQATDISTQALDVARANAEQLEIKNVEFIHSDWFDELEPSSQFNLILANPPYVAEKTPHLQQNDVRYEPRSALVSGEDGLDALRILINKSLLYLKNNGWVIFEIGYDQSDQITDLVYRAGYNFVFFIKDLADIKRHCIAHKP